MASTDTEARVRELITKADELAKGLELQKAAEALREASHLEPDSERLKEAWQRLQVQESHGQVVELIRLYLGSKQEEDGQKALDALKSSRLPDDVATEVVDLLLNSPEELALCDTLTGVVLNRNEHVRRDLASKFSERVVELFDQLYDRGNNSFTAFAGIALDDKTWVSTSKQVKAQVDVFQLSVAKLIESGVDKPERAMRVIARQLATAPENVKSAIDSDVCEVIFGCLDIRLTVSLRSQAILATSKLLEVQGEAGESCLSNFVTSRVAKQTFDDLVLAFSAGAAVFPVVPLMMAKLFMTDGFVQQLVPNLERNSTAVADGKIKSESLERAALELLSAACVDKACREAIDRYCRQWLQDLCEDREGTHKALAALVLAKISASSDDSRIVSQLAHLVINGDSERDQAIEGLAYTSLQPKVKEEIAHDTDLVKTVVQALHERPAALFGCLTVLLNLTQYKMSQSEEQKRMAQLKAYAASQKPTEDDPLDNDKHVTLRCRAVLDADVVPGLVASCKQNASLTNVAIVVRILLALAREQHHRPKMVQQGAVKLLLQVRDRISKTDKATTEAATIERDASHALARLLISSNPAHVFSSSLPASSAVSGLVSLLTIDSDSETRNLLPTFEALLALTNLASMEDNSICELIVRQAWTNIEDLLLSSNVLVQRATVELVCNLMVAPSCVAKYADGSKDANRRMQVLLALADAEDFATRRAAGGALAMLTEWDAAVTAVLDKPNGARVLLTMCRDDSEEVRHRGLVCINNIISAPGDVGKRGLEQVKSDGGAESVKRGLVTTKNPEMLSIGVDVLKKLG